MYISITDHCKNHRTSRHPPRSWGERPARPPRKNPAVEHHGMRESNSKSKRYMSNIVVCVSGQLRQTECLIQWLERHSQSCLKTAALHHIRHDSGAKFSNLGPPFARTKSLTLVNSRFHDFPIEFPQKRVIKVCRINLFTPCLLLTRPQAFLTPPSLKYLTPTLRYGFHVCQTLQPNFSQTPSWTLQSFYDQGRHGSSKEAAKS